MTTRFWAARRVAVVLCLVSSAAFGEGTSRPPLQWGPVALSYDDDFGNAVKLHEFIQGVYYSQFSPSTDRSHWASIWADISDGLRDLASLARTTQGLRRAVAMELYHWFFFLWKGGEVPAAVLDDESLELACELMALGLQTDEDCAGGGAGGREALIRFLEKGCQYHWLHLVMFEVELGRELAARAGAAGVWRAAKMLRSADRHFKTVMALPYYAGLPWATPYDMNFNAELRYPSRPFWPSKQLPLEEWLEQHHGTIKGELDAVLRQPGLFDWLHRIERNAEGLDHAREADWNIIELADTREEEQWKERACEHFPETCKLLKQRRELDCDHAAAFVNRMRPGGWVKPHMGGPPRLVVHLGLSIPNDPITLHVGDEEIYWETGKAHTIDDTYIHSVRHQLGHDSGAERYILHLLVCHPCEPNQRELYVGRGVSCP